MFLTLLLVALMLASAVSLIVVGISAGVKI